MQAAFISYALFLAILLLFVLVIFIIVATRSLRDFIRRRREENGPTSTDKRWGR